MMNYFKNTNNEIFAYDDEQIKKGYGKDLTPITEDEKDAILAPSPEKIEKQRISSIKAKANELIEMIYPIYKQNNVLMSQIDTDIKGMNAYILNIRNISNEAETKGTKPEDINWEV